MSIRISTARHINAPATLEYTVYRRYDNPATIEPNRSTKQMIIQTVRRHNAYKVQCVYA